MRLFKIVVYCDVCQWPCFTVGRVFSKDACILARSWYKEVGGYWWELTRNFCWCFHTTSRQPASYWPPQELLRTKNCGSTYIWYRCRSFLVSQFCLFIKALPEELVWFCGWPFSSGLVYIFQICPCPTKISGGWCKSEENMNYWILQCFWKIFV